MNDNGPNYGRYMLIGGLIGGFFPFLGSCLRVIWNFFIVLLGICFVLGLGISAVEYVTGWDLSPPEKEVVVVNQVEPVESYTSISGLPVAPDADIRDNHGDTNAAFAE